MHRFKNDGRIWYEKNLEAEFAYTESMKLKGKSIKEINKGIEKLDHLGFNHPLKRKKK